MASIKFKGETIHTSGQLPMLGSKSPDFLLVRADLARRSLKDYKGKRKVLNIFPSLDTPVCALSVKLFNKRASEFENTIVLNISADLPFASKRFCAAEGIDKVESLSTLGSSFPKDYGVLITDSPLAGLCARAVVILDEQDNVIYLEQVPEIAQEPNYDAAINSLK